MGGMDNDNRNLKELKMNIRKRVIEKRDSMPYEERVSKSRAIFEKLIDMPEYKEADNVLVYASMRSEVNTDDIILDSLSGGKNVFCPKCLDKKNGIMKFIRIDRFEDLKEGYYGIREPEYNEDSVVFDEQKGNSLVIVPGVAFDNAGNRIGYNGGYYDRFFMKHPDVTSVALAYDIQIVSEVPTEQHDIPVQNVIS